MDPSILNDYGTYYNEIDRFNDGSVDLKAF